MKKATNNIDIMKKATDNIEKQIQNKEWTAPKLTVLPVSFTASGGGSVKEGGAYTTMAP
jgi:hypothetical protein